MRHDGHSIVRHALDSVRPHDGTHWFSELQGRSAGVRTNIVKGAHTHALHGASGVKTHFHIKNTVRPLHVTAAHVFDAVFYKAHRPPQLASQIAHQNRVL